MELDRVDADIAEAAVEEEEVEAVFGETVVVSPVVVTPTLGDGIVGIGDGAEEHSAGFESGRDGCDDVEDGIDGYVFKDVEGEDEIETRFARVQVSEGLFDGDERGVEIDPLAGLDLTFVAIEPFEVIEPERLESGEGEAHAAADVENVGGAVCGEEGAEQAGVEGHHGGTMLWRVLVPLQIVARVINFHAARETRGEHYANGTGEERNSVAIARKVGAV